MSQGPGLFCANLRKVIIMYQNSNTMIYSTCDDRGGSHEGISEGQVTISRWVWYGHCKMLASEKE